MEVDHCAACRGWWLDALELERITQLAAREIRTSDSAGSAARPASTGPLPCPRCGGGQLIRLNSLERPGTILNSCTVCYGVWVDAGELAHVARADTLAAALQSFFKRN